MKIHNHMKQSFRKHSLTVPYEVYGGDKQGGIWENERTETGWEVVAVI